MKNIKDITISIFAIIGFVAILSSFNNQTQQEVQGTPESHVWEISSQENDAYMWNKITVEVRKLPPSMSSGKYVTLVEKD